MTGLLRNQTNQGLLSNTNPSGLLGDIVPKRKPDFELVEARRTAERRYPFIKQFPQVGVARAIAQNKGGMGEFVEPGDPTNPNPKQWTITIGDKSKTLQGGISDTIIADMVHAAGQFNPEFQELKSRLIENLDPGEVEFARRKYEQDYKGKHSGSNFETFDNFLKNYWIEGMVQHLLLPEKSEIGAIRKHNPDARPILDEIEKLFLQAVR